MNRDPLGEAGGINLYGFVQNDPVNWVDPEGLHKKDKTYGLPKKFWSWYHKKRKKDGDPDLSRDEADDFLDEWKDLGEPGPDRKRRRGPKGGGRGFRGFSPPPCYTTADCFCLQHPAECCALFPEKYYEGKE